MDRAQHRYSAELKQRIVQEVEGGHLSLREAARDAQTSVTMIQKWLEEFGRYKPKRDVVEVVMKSEQDRIAALEKALAEAHVKLQVYEEVIAQANKRYKTDLKKTLGSPSLAPAMPAASPSLRSARSSDDRATPTTNGSADRPGPRATRKR